MVKIIPDFQTAFDSFLSVKGLDNKTIKDYNFFFHKFINKYNELNQQNIDSFLTHNPSPSARATIVNLRKSILRWGFPLEMRQEVSAIDIPSRSSKQGKATPKVLTRSDVNTLDLSISLNNLYETERIKLMILTQFYAGLRIQEICNLRLEDLDIKSFDKTKRFQFITISYESAKFGKERKAYLPTEIYIRLIKWYKVRATRQKKNIANTNIWGIGSSRYKTLFHKVTKEILGESYNTHALRHGRGNDLRVVEKRAIDVVQRYMGHSSIKSTQIYTHFGDAQLQKELEED